MNHSEETKRKISESRKGKCLGNQNGFIKGDTPWNKGLKVRLNPKGEFKKGQLPWNTGKRDRRVECTCIICSKKFEEFKSAINKEHRGKYCSRKCWNVYAKSFGIRGRLIQSRTNKPTSIEQRVYKTLKDMGLLFEIQKVINGRFIVDAYLPDFNLIVEADGKYWHTQEKVVKKDRAENAYLAKCGYKLLRLNEQEIMNNKIVNKIERMVS